MVRIDPKKDRLPGGNRELLNGLAKTMQIDPELLTILQIIADVLDLRSEGKDALLFIGGSQDFCSASLGVKVDGAKAVVYSTDLMGLGAQAQSLL